MRTEPLAIELGMQLIVEQPPEQHDVVAGHLWLKLVRGTVGGDSGIRPDFAPLGLPSKAAELIP